MGGENVKFPTWRVFIGGRQKGAEEEYETKQKVNEDVYPEGSKDTYPGGSKDTYPRGLKDVYPRGSNGVHPGGPKDGTKFQFAYKYEMIVTIRDNFSF